MNGRGRKTPDLAHEQDRGIATVLAALTIVPLLILAAFAVDVGGWYARATRMQKAADAAALAGVVWMPDFTKASQVAHTAAKRNGFEHGVDNVTVTVAKVTGNDHRLRVTIGDSRADQYFSQIVVDDVSLSRSAVGEYVLPVPLGSPRNVFGTGNLLGSPENFWAAVNGYCAGHESGDLKLARWESYSLSTGSASQCNNGSQSTPDYNPEGYLYAVELPQASGSLRLEAYDPSYVEPGCSGGASAPDVRLPNERQTITTTFEVYDTDDTPFDRSDNPLVATVSALACDTTFKNSWRTLHTWSAPAAGTYYVRVKTAVETAESRGSNGFGLRAFTGGSFSVCTTIPGQPGFSANCPQVHGVDDMSIFANLGGSSGSTATFYLAQVEAVHAGKTMRVSLFDAGEGAAQIEVLDPNGNPTSFNWRTPCNPPNPPAGSCSGSGSALNVSGQSLPQPYSGLQSTWRYNDRTMHLDIDLPVNYSTLYGTKVWWRIRYTLGSTPTDRTTWSVLILGDPVHLVE